MVPCSSSIRILGCWVLHVELRGTELRRACGYVVILVRGRLVVGGTELLSAFLATLGIMIGMRFVVARYAGFMGLELGDGV